MKTQAAFLHPASPRHGVLPARAAQKPGKRGSVEDTPAEGQELQHYLVALQTVRFFLLQLELHGIRRIDSLRWLLIVIQNFGKAGSLQEHHRGSRQPTPRAETQGPRRLASRKGLADRQDRGPPSPGKPVAESQSSRAARAGPSGPPLTSWSGLPRQSGCAPA